MCVAIDFSAPEIAVCNILESLQTELEELKARCEELQGQLKAINAGLTALKLKISARYEGASLVLTGATDAAGQKKALWEVFRRSAGRVAMDDQVEVAPPPDAGTPAPR